MSTSPASALRLAACIASTLLAISLPAQDFSHPDTQPAPSAAFVQQANDALAAGDFPAALKILTHLNTQTPHNPQILYDLGLALEASDSTQPDSTQPDSTQPDSTQPDSTQPDSTQPSPSAPTSTPPATPESCYRQSISADASFPPPHVALGLLLARTNRPTEARTELLAAINLPATDPALKGRALRALAKLDLDGDPAHGSPPNPAAASDALLAALKITPELPEDVLLSAGIAEAAADLPAAEAAYRRFLALPGNAADPQATDQATAALAHVLLSEHHPAEAETLLVPALAHSPGNPSFTAQLAEAYLASGDPDKIAKAIPLVESLHAKNPTNTNITRLLARVYQETGHPDQADPLYDSLITAQSGHPDPALQVDRAEVLIRLHRPAEAEKLLKQAVAKPAAFPSPAAFADAATDLAVASEEIDDPRSALQALALRATVQQPSPASLFLQATANDDLHQTTQAVELYKRFLAAANGSLPDQESQARQRIAALEHRK
jgi:tetratricopeptide (TPR) repeat protein